MLQTVGGTGSIQVAQAGGTQQLQQLQVVPASGIQVSWPVVGFVMGGRKGKKSCRIEFHIQRVVTVNSYTSCVSTELWRVML